MKKLFLVLLVSGPMATAQAAMLDFGGDVCAAASSGVGAFTACANGAFINQAYGDTSELDVTYAADAGNAASMSFWDSSYSGLTRVAYGGSGGSTPTVTLAPRAGSVVTLGSFQLGAWPNSDRGSRWAVTEIATGSVLASSNGAITVLGTVPLLVSLNLSSARGFVIDFGPDGFNVGIDNIQLSTAPIPEPATWALLATGLALLGAAARRRSFD